MGIEDINISETLETNAPSIKYRGNEGPKSPQEEKMMMLIQKLMSQGMGQEEAMQVAQQMMAQAEQQQQGIESLGAMNQDPRQMAAYGGIMGGVETPKRGLVDGPGSYAGIGSWFQKNIMDPIKNNPEVAAAAAIYGLDTFGGGEIMGKTIPGGGKKINSFIGNIFGDKKKILKKDGETVFEKD